MINSNEREKITILELSFALLITLIWILSMMLYSFSHRVDGEIKYVYAPTDETLNIEYSYWETDKTRQQLKYEIEELVGIRGYKYKEEDLQGSLSGLCEFGTNTVTIDIYLDDQNYVKALVHELCHVKYRSTDERYTEFKTFEYLYNSQFKQVALNLAYVQMCGYVPIEYNCWYYIYNYLK